MTSREASRPDPHAPTELAHLPLQPQRRTDEVRPPAATPAPTTGTIRNLKDLEGRHALLQRDLEEHRRALGYVEEKADRANAILDGHPGGEPGLRTVVAVLTKGIESVNNSVVKTQESTRSMQRSVVLALFVIAGALAWMAFRGSPS